MLARIGPRTAHAFATVSMDTLVNDPPTSPNRYLDQVWFGLLAALSAGAAQLLGAGQVYLLVGLVVPNAVLALVRYARRASNSSLVSARAAF